MQLAAIGREPVGLRGTFQHTLLSPMLTVITVDGPLVVPAGKDISVVHRQRLNSLAIGSSAWSPLGLSFIAIETGRRVHRSCVEFATIDDHSIDRFRVWQRATVEPLPVPLVAIDLSAQMRIFGLVQRRS